MCGSILRYHKESEVHPVVASSPLINIVPIAPIPNWLRTNSKLLFLVVAPLKAFWQAWSLYHALGYRTKAAKWMLVQVRSTFSLYILCVFIFYHLNVPLRLLIAHTIHQQSICWRCFLLCEACSLLRFGNTYSHRVSTSRFWLRVFVPKYHRSLQPLITTLYPGH